MDGHLIDAIGSIYSTIYGVVNATLIRLIYPAEVCFAYLLLEVAFPRSRNSLRSYAKAASFVAAAVVINTILLTLANTVTGIGNVKPLAILDLRPLTESPQFALRVAGWLVAAFAVSVIGNFFYYWYHRAQHAVPLLWRFHSLHHSITEMSAASSYHHFTEDFFQFVAVVLPMSYLLGVESGPVPWLVLTIASTQTYFIHSSTKLGIGPVRYVLGDNRFHRIHHSLEARHFHRNFGTSTPLWDVLFGTAYFPGRGEWPAVGLADMAPPQTVREYVLRPFGPEAVAEAR